MSWGCLLHGPAAAAAVGPTAGRIDGPSRCPGTATPLRQNTCITITRSRTSSRRPGRSAHELRVSRGGPPSADSSWWSPHLESRRPSPMTTEQRCSAPPPPPPPPCARAHTRKQQTADRPRPTLRHQHASAARATAVPSCTTDRYRLREIMRSGTWDAMLPWVARRERSGARVLSELWT